MLLDNFWNSTTIDKINELTIQDENCKLYLDKKNKIASNPEKKKKFISDNNFDKGKFYGFILFYLNIYDDKQFQSLSKKLREQKEKIFSLRFWFSTPQFFQMMLIYLWNSISIISLEKILKNWKCLALHILKE